MPLDFYGIQMEASIKVPQTIGPKVVYDLWINNSPQSSDLPLALRDLTYVTQIGIQIGLALNSKVSVTMSLPLDVGLEFINSELINWAGSELEVIIGYSTGTDEDRLTTQRFGGLVMKPDVRGNGEGISVTLTALGVAYGMNLSNATEARSYKSSSPWAAVKDTLELHSVDTSDESLIFPDFKDPAERQPNTATHPFFKIAKQVVGTENGFTKLVDKTIEKSSRNDWWFIREIIKEYGLDLVIIDTKPIIRDPEKWKVDRPRKKFVLKGAIDTEQNIFPILDFNTPSAYVWLGSGVGGMAMKDVSVDKKEVIEKVITTAKTFNRPQVPTEASVFVDNLEIAAQKLSGFAVSAVPSFADKAQSIPISRTAPGAYNSGGSVRDAADVFPGSPEDARADQMESELRNLNHAMGIQMEISTLGIPTLLPSQVVELDGFLPEGQLGRFNKNQGFNGNYGVMLVEHEIGQGGMMTKFKALMNANFNEHTGGIEGAGQVNDSSAPDEVDMNSVTKYPTGD